MHSRRSWPKGCSRSASFAESLTPIITTKVLSTSEAECSASDTIAADPANIPAINFSSDSTMLITSVITDTRIAVFVSSLFVCFIPFLLFCVHTCRAEIKKENGCYAVNSRFTENSIFHLIPVKHPTVPQVWFLLPLGGPASRAAWRAACSDLLFILQIMPSSQVRKGAAFYLLSLLYVDTAAKGYCDNERQPCAVLQSGNFGYWATGFIPALPLFCLPPRVQARSCLGIARRRRTFSGTCQGISP